MGLERSGKPIAYPDWLAGWFDGWKLAHAKLRQNVKRATDPNASSFIFVFVRHIRPRSENIPGSGFFNNLQALISFRFQKIDDLR